MTPENDEDWIEEMEYQLITLFGWSLHDIDLTDIESLLPFVFYVGQRKGVGNQTARAGRTYCDQVGWL